MFATWREFYQSDLQSVYALWLVPAFFMLYWLLSRPSGSGGVESRAVPFLNVYAPVFAIETVLDPYLTGPLLRWLSVEEPDITLWQWVFALVGGFRAYLLVFYVLDPLRGTQRAISRAASWTLLTLIIAAAGYALLQSRHGALPSGAIRILYEAGSFFLMQIILARILPVATDLHHFEVRQYVAGLVRYVALYYALWAIADLLIVGWEVDWLGAAHDSEPALRNVDSVRLLHVLLTALCDHSQTRESSAVRRLHVLYSSGAGTRPRLDFDSLRTESAFDDPTPRVRRCARRARAGH